MALIDDVIQSFEELNQLVELLLRKEGIVMAMTIYKMAGVTLADSTAVIDIQTDGEIKAIFMSLEGIGFNAADEETRAELSFASANSFGTNDVRGSLMQLRVASGLLTSGMMQSSANAGISGLSIT
ncbi:hypothetical protein LCGC14_2717840, partial [marine sediment metagenome]